MTNNNYEREFGWNDEITKDAEEYLLLPEGNYLFRVENFERARYTPSREDAKLPACNMAILKLFINTEEGSTTVNYKLYLHSITEGMLSAFFGAIGMKKKGEPLKMNWNKVIGAEGVCHIAPKRYDGKEYNEVKRMIHIDDVDVNSILNKNVSSNPNTQMSFEKVNEDIPW